VSEEKRERGGMGTHDTGKERKIEKKKDYSNVSLRGSAKRRGESPASRRGASKYWRGSGVFEGEREPS